MLLFNVCLIAVITAPGFYFLREQYIYLLVVILALFTLASSLEQATTSVAVVENYPTPARYTGLSLGYNIGNAIFGGTAPLICEWLMVRTHFVLAPAVYIMLCAGVTGFVVLFFVKDTRYASLV
jgi:MFS transporter, MHS family, proline/betaine transporter